MQVTFYETLLLHHYTTQNINITKHMTKKKTIQVNDHKDVEGMTTC